MTTPMMVLGICGAAGSGKTTLANLLVNCGWKRTRFSQGLKSMLAAFLSQQGVENDVVWDMLDGKLKEEPTKFLNGRSPRHAMQTLGTEWRNMIHRDLWVDAWRRNINNYPPGTKILVDDLRFHHEARVIRELNGKIIRIRRPGLNLDEFGRAHISETEALTLEVDGEITNDRTPDHMLTQLATLMEYWK